MKRGVLVGAVSAVGTLLLIPGVASAVGRAGKPLVRAGMRSGAVACDEFRKAGLEVFEHLEDIAAEIREEMQAERARAGTETTDADVGNE